MVSLPFFILKIMPAKIILKTEVKEEIRKQFYKGFGTRKIAQNLGITRYQVSKAFIDLGLDEIKRDIIKKEQPKHKVCKGCDLDLDISNFRNHPKKGQRFGYEAYCKKCMSLINKVRLIASYYDDERINKIYKSKNIKDCKGFIEKFRDERRSKKIKCLQCKKKCNKYNNTNNGTIKKFCSERCYNKYNQIKYYSKIENKIRNRVSCSVRGHLKKSKSTKGASCLNHLPYTIEELKLHLEFHFEDWMSWDNWGRYDVSSWKDNDKSTWTWQIDHIKPHSDFGYKSMKDDEFIECWSLGNLRPLSSKENLLDGTRRIRHK